MASRSLCCTNSFGDRKAFFVHDDITINQNGILNGTAQCKPCTVHGFNLMQHAEGTRTGNIHIKIFGQKVKLIGLMADCAALKINLASKTQPSSGSNSQ